MLTKEDYGNAAKFRDDIDRMNDLIDKLHN